MSRRAAAAARSVARRWCSTKTQGPLAPPVLLLGDPRLRRRSSACVYGESDLLHTEALLHAALLQHELDHLDGEIESHASSSADLPCGH